MVQYLFQAVTIKPSGNKTYHPPGAADYGFICSQNISTIWFTQMVEVGTPEMDGGEDGQSLRGIVDGEVAQCPGQRADLNLSSV